MIKIKTITKLEKDLDTISFLTSKVLKRVPVGNKLKITFNDLRHEWIFNKLKPLFDEAYNSITFDNLINSNNGPIWILWWQGIEAMPPLVRKCYESVIDNSNQREVILITKDNYEMYTNLPDFILKKLTMNEMTLTHFSDIIRFNLLKNYGGLWIDSTVFVNKPITKKYFERIFTCSGYSSTDHFFVTQGNWTGFLIGGSKNLELFQFMNAFFEYYWKENNLLLDYFLIDYALAYAWDKNIDNFKKYSQEVKGINNPNLFELYPLLNKKYDVDIMKKISKNTEMYKLSYKGKLSNNMSNFYHVLFD